MIVNDCFVNLYEKIRDDALEIGNKINNNIGY